MLTDQSLHEGRESHAGWTQKLSQLLLQLFKGHQHREDRGAKTHLVVVLHGAKTPHGVEALVGIKSPAVLRGESGKHARLAHRGVGLQRQRVIHVDVIIAAVGGEKRSGVAQGCANGAGRRALVVVVVVVRVQRVVAVVNVVILRGAQQASRNTGTRGRGRGRTEGGVVVGRRKVVVKPCKSRDKI